MKKGDPPIVRRRNSKPTGKSWEQSEKDEKSNPIWGSWKLEELGAIFFMELLNGRICESCRIVFDEGGALRVSVFRVGSTWMEKWRRRPGGVREGYTLRSMSVTDPAICLLSLPTPLTFAVYFILLSYFLTSSCWNQKRPFFFSQEQKQGSLGVIVLRTRWCDWRGHSAKKDVKLD